MVAAEDGFEEGGPKVGHLAHRGERSVRDGSGLCVGGAAAAAGPRDLGECQGRDEEQCRCRQRGAVAPEPPEPWVGHCGSVRWTRQAVRSRDGGKRLSGEQTGVSDCGVEH